MSRRQAVWLLPERRRQQRPPESPVVPAQPRKTIRLVRRGQSREKTDGVIIAVEFTVCVWGTITWHYQQLDWQSGHLATSILTLQRSLYWTQHLRLCFSHLLFPALAHCVLPEFAHRLAAETRIVLISGTDCDQEYQAVVRFSNSTIGGNGFESPNRFGQPVRRLGDEVGIHNAIASILRRASCFLIYATYHTRPRPPEIEYYRGDQTPESSHSETIGE